MRYSRELLETLVATIDGGTFDAAARALRVTPSAVSQRIKAAEVELGRVLVVRSKPVRATAAGEAVLRLARQTALLAHGTDAELGIEGAADAPVSLPIAVNADSVASWLLPAFASAAAELPVVFDLRREDQDRTARLLADGTVMAAVTSQAAPVPGCTVAPLGRMRYRAAASRAFVARRLPDGPTAAAFASAPMVNFDRDDTLQDRYLRRVTRRRLDPPRHYVSASADFARAIALGLGWGMMLPEQFDEHPDVVDLDPARPVDVPLYWQQWELRSPLLDAVAEAVRAAAHAALR